MDTKKLLSDYRHNRLTPESLFLLRKESAGTDTSRLELLMEDLWESEPLDVLSDPDSDRNDRTDRMLKRISRRTRRPAVPLLYQAVTWAAAVLLPVLLCTSLFLYQRTEKVRDNLIVVTTQRGEQASAQLPDGTVVSLNADSKLLYRPFNYDNDRRVEFEGEGYFEVATHPKIPFMVETPDIRVCVLGTKFNLKARSSNSFVEVMLDEGKVELTDLTSQARLLLQPLEKGTFDREQRTFSVVKTGGKEVSSWRQGEMVFYRTPLKEVLKAIENQYGVNITIHVDEQLDEDKFTGTFTTRNLIESLNMIKHCYGLNYSVTGKEVAFTR